LRGAVALGIAIALASAWPLLPMLTTSIPAPADCAGQRCADQALLLWLTTQAGRNLYASPLALFEAPVFHPMRHALAYSESMLSAAVFVGPLEWLTGSPIAAYNLHYLATIVLSVLGMYLLVREITGDARAGLVAGGLFGLATERGMWWEFPPALAVHWAPVLVWAWLRFLGRPSWLRGVGLGLALLAHMHSGAYHGLMLPMLLGPWAAVLAIFGAWPLRRWLASAVPLAVAGAAGAALYYPYAVVADELQYRPASLAFALPGQYAAGVARPLEYAASRMTSAEGFIVSPLAWYLLAAAALAALVRRARTPGPAALGVHLAAALVLTALAMLVSFGPGVPTPVGPIPGPLALLRALPGFAAMRAAVRFMVLAAFARTLVAGIATAIVLRRLPPAGGRAVAGAVLALAAADARVGTSRPVEAFTIPPAWAKGYAWLAGTLPDTAIVEIPYGYWERDARMMVYALSHRRRIMNGYSAVMPRFSDVVNRLPDPVAWQALQEAGVQYVLAHPAAGEASPLIAAHLTGLTRRKRLVVAELDDTVILAVPPPLRQPLAPLGPELSREGWRGEATAPGIERALDGDLATHWRASHAKRHVRVRLDLGRETAVGAVLLELGQHLLEYPRRYQLRASRDGHTWKVVGRESPTLPPFASYRRDHRRTTLRLRMEPTTARWLELRVPVQPSGAWMYSDGRIGIHEIRVFAPAPDAARAAPAAPVRP
jgi:hypothetical protein